MKTRLSLMLAIAGMIIAGAMLVGVVSANDPEPAEPQQVEVIVRIVTDAEESDDAWKEKIESDIKVLQRCGMTTTGRIVYVDGEYKCNPSGR